MPNFSQIISTLSSFEQLSNRGFIEKRHAEYSQYIESASIKPKVMFNYCNQTIGCYCRIYLDPNCIFRNSPKGFYKKMMLDPFEEKLHLPSVFIEHSNVFSADFKPVSKIGKGSFMLRRIINNSPKKTWVFYSRLWTGKSYCLVLDNIVGAFKKIFTINDIILKLPSLPNYKIGSDKIDRLQSGKVKIAAIKDIPGIWLIRDLVHGIHVVNPGFSNMNKRWDLRYNITKGMYLDSSFGLAEVCPPEEIHTQIDSGRIESIESAIKYKVPGNSLPLGNSYHFIGKLFKNLAVPIGVRFRKITSCNNRLAKTHMVRLRRMCRHYTNKFSKAFTARQLTIHHDQKLIPAAERLDIFVTLIIHNDTIKSSLWQKLDELTENIFPSVHSNLIYKSVAIYNFKSTR